MDSSEFAAYCEPEDTACNEHFKLTGFPPRLLFSRDVDGQAAKLRPRNLRSAQGWEALMLPEIERQQKMGNVVLRVDAVLAEPKIHEAPESRGVKQETLGAISIGRPRDAHVLMMWS
jgi:hypothetical protein